MHPGLDHVTLHDGRRLDVRVSGPEDGYTLVFHHGTPGAGTPLHAFERAAHERGMRLVTLTRPGYGGSSRLEGRRVVDVAPDTSAVLEALGVERCAVAGWSGGGPHALACAARLDEVAAALVIAGVAPADAEDLDWMAGMGRDNVDEFGAAKEGPDVLRSYLGEARALLMATSPDDLAGSLASLLPPVDQAVLTSELAQDLEASFLEGLRDGVDGWLDDDLAFVSAWGFDLDEIAVPTAVWQGSDDLMVPFAHGRWLSGRVPGATTHLLAHEGHLSIMPGAVGAMLDELLSLARR